MIRTDRAMTFGWGVYCACSWTWCIGMFLPVVLIHRFGWAGFLAFAVPNVIGCTLFGYLVHNAQRSFMMVRTHGRVMAAFSSITILYHMFFVGLIMSLMLNDAHINPIIVAFVAACVLGLALLASSLPSNVWPGLAVAVYIVSLILLITRFDQLFAIPWSGVAPMPQLMWLLPIFCFGFLLCPLFDLTFHRAMQTAPSRNAFAVFGVGFLLMLLLTCAYAWIPARGVQGGLIISHLLAQTVFTVGAHAREIRHSGAVRNRSIQALFLIVPVLGIAMAGLAIHREWIYPTFEHYYIRFLVFYALVFPAYALVFMIARIRIERTRQHLLGTAGAVLLLAPLYEIGFQGEAAWVLSVPIIVGLLWITFRMSTASAPLERAVRT